MTPQRKNFWVGLVVAGATVALGWMLLKFSGETMTALFTKGTNIRLVSERVDGVSEGSPIFYLGVTVGRVMGVRRADDNNGVIIDATIDAKQPLPRNLVGVIRQQSPLSNSAQISLESSGRPTKETLTAGTELAAKFQGGGVIPPEVAELAAQVREQKLILHVDETVLAVHTQLEKIGKLLDHMNEIAGDPDLQKNIKLTLDSVRQTSENLNKFSGRLEGLADETKTTLAQVRTTVGDGGKRIDDVGRNLGERLTQVGDILGKFQGIAAKIDKGDGTAGKIVNDPRLYESLVDTSRELNETVKTLKRMADQWEHEGIPLKLGK